MKLKNCFICVQKDFLILFISLGLTNLDCNIHYYPMQSESRRVKFLPFVIGYLTLDYISNCPCISLL